ncbi:acyltransferase domain-containing protein [Ramlibacter sp.]|uniref:acyltransferase domain-containing protein n=1 Tax=Ramlibacter sp. TaxID=1917967 RepID=UPI00180C80C1|nr:acyltransferase domain-containing protein [Ramlibacter sp.]MBA2676115.1 acyltransferase domain-containing protein [Ramlibacter sp.]
MKNVFLFSGQGSQYYQMGAPLLAAHAGFAARMRALDAIATGVLGSSVLAQVYDPAKKKSDAFTPTAATGVAIFMVENALVEVFREAGITPDVVVGSSLGMFAAACHAGCMDAREAMQAIVWQAEVLLRHCPRGAMMAVFDAPALYERQPELKRNAELAAVNFAAHFTLAAPDAQLSPLEAFLDRGNIGYSRLPVELPFHSRWMEPAKDDFLTHFARIPYRAPTLPLVCCARAGALQSLSADNFWQVLREPIRFQQTIAALEATGPHRYIDAGPSGTLATFLKYGLPKTSGSQYHPGITAFDNDTRRLDALLARLRADALPAAG